jgi:hypothetical protein
MKFGRNTYGGDRPISTQQPIMVTGGFSLDQTVNSFDEGVVIPAGTLVAYDSVTRKAKVHKTAKVSAIDSGDAKIVTLFSDVKPTFKVGDKVLKAVAGTLANAPVINAISNTSTGYIITLSAAISGLAVGDIIFQTVADATTPTNAGLIASSFQALTIADAEVKASTAETGIDITVDSGAGAFYAKRIPPIPSGFLTGNVLKDNHNIKITNSY